MFTNKTERDLLINTILRGEASLPAEAFTAAAVDDPDMLAVRIIADLHNGKDAAKMARITAFAADVHSGHTLLRLLAAVADVGSREPHVMAGWLATLASDDMRRDILGKMHAAA